MTPDFRAQKAKSSHKWLRGAGLGLLACAAAYTCPAFGSDFVHAQKVIVPASTYDRRIDISSIREQYTDADKNSTDKSGKSTGSKSKSKTIGQAKTTTASKTGSAKPAATASTPAQKAIEKAADSISGKSISDLLNAKMSPELVAKMKQAALNLEKSGKLEDAQKLLTRVAQMTPEDKANLQQLATLGVQRARAYMKTNDFQNALLQARTALSATPGDPEANQILNQLYKKYGADPNDVNRRLKTADGLYQQGRYAEAEVEYRSSLTVKPTAEAQVGIGRVSEKLTGPGTGKQYFEHALEVDSNSAIAHRELGLSHLTNGDVVSANSELSRALILNPQDKEAGSNLIKLWQTQVSKLPNANSHLGLARAYQLNGDLQSAQAEYREVVRLDPNHPYLPQARQSFKNAWARQEAEKSLAAARNLESQGLISDAYLKASEAVNSSPGNSAYKIYQGDLLEKMGQPAQAKQVYLSVLKDDPQNAVAAQRIKGLGTALMAGGQPQLPAGINNRLTRQPDGFPGSKFPSLFNGDGVPPVTGRSGAQVDHIGQLGNFASALLWSQPLLKQMSDPPAAAGSGGGDGEGAAKAPSDLKSLLNSPGPASSSATTAAVEGGAASALANAAAALAAVKGGSASSPSATRTTTAAPAAHAATTSPAPATPPTFNPGGLTASPQAAPDYAPMSPYGSPSSASQYQAPAMMSGQMGGYNSLPNQFGTPASPAAPDLSDPGLKGPLANPQPVRFELKEIKPTLRDVQLRVVLCNDSDAAVAIPPNLQAVIRYNNQTESELRASFEEKSIAPHSTVDGVVRVPFNKVDPTADLILRNLLPQELHIIKTAISQR